MNIFREPGSWNVPTGNSQSPGPEHAWYKWFNGSIYSETLLLDEKIPIPGIIKWERSEARSYGALQILIFQGRYAPSEGNVWRLRCSHEVNLWTEFDFNIVSVSNGQTENWCLTYIGSYTHIGFYMSAIMYAPGHHWPNMSKTQPLELDDGLSERTGVV